MKKKNHHMKMDQIQATEEILLQFQHKQVVKKDDEVEDERDDEVEDENEDEIIHQTIMMTEISKSYKSVL
jgi:hypothetical protein